MRIAVTGATGFIGQRLVRHAVARGDRVTALVRGRSDPAALLGLGVRVREVDWATGAGMAEAVAGAECVLHLAGVTAARDQRGYLAGNADTTAVLARSLASLPDPPRLVYCSSLAAAGPSPVGQPRREEDPPRPVSHYGRSKLAGEAAVRAVHTRVAGVIVRPPIVYGPGDREFLPRLLPLVRAGVVPQAGRGPRHYSLIHVDDLAEALFAAAAAGPTVASPDPACAAGVYLVSDGSEYTWQDIARTVADTFGYRAPRVVPVPVALARTLARAAELAARAHGKTSVLNRDKAREMPFAAWTCSPHAAARDLGFAPAIPLEKGLAGLLAHH